MSVTEWLGSLTSNHLSFTVVGSNLTRDFGYFDVSRLYRQLAEGRWFYLYSGAQMCLKTRRGAVEVFLRQWKPKSLTRNQNQYEQMPKKYKNVTTSYHQVTPLNLVESLAHCETTIMSFSLAERCDIFRIIW